ncbi:hypothetical protein AB0L71_28505 [Streptomyces sp. NPDC052052]|uniref:hypothetical protein n=1 Tax=Streptomyces sp. NPDC052052 TaxID=3154756 RepID=UPI00341FEBD2
MGNVVMPFLYTVLALNVAVVAVAALRYRNRRPGSNPAAFVRYRPDQHPAVVSAEHLVADTYQRIGDLYVQPTTDPRPAP